MLSPLDETSVYKITGNVIKTSNEIILIKNMDGSITEYIDLNSAYGSCNFGHCNPNILLRNIEADLVACCYHEDAKKFEKWITTKLNLFDHSVLYQIGGSHAVSAALSIAQRVRPGKIAYVKGSFHGLGLDSLSITSVQNNFALQNTPMISDLCTKCICIDPNQNSSHINIKWNEISAFIYEPIQGANGYVPLPTNWLQGIIDIAKFHNVITIADEIQCGYFRHGYLSVSNDTDLKPDILLFSKSMTNGQYPFSAILYPSKFNKTITGHIFLAHTFQTSAIGCMAAMSVANFIDDNDIQSLSNNVKKHFVRFNDFLKSCKNIKNIELTGPTISFELLNKNKIDIIESCLQKNILVFRGGNNGERIRLAPPLTINEKNLVYSIDSLTEIINKS